MNKILIGVVAVAVLGGAYFLSSGGGVPAGDHMMEDGTMMEGGMMDGADEAAMDVPATGMRTLKSIMAAGGAHECTFTSEDPNASNKGTVYVSGDSIRGEFESNVQGMGMMKSHMIQHKGVMYMWSDAAPQGMKMAIPESGDMGGQGAASGQMNFDAGVEMAYDCKPWIPDNASFSAPSGVEFMDMSQMGGMMQGKMPR